MIQKIERREDRGRVVPRDARTNILPLPQENEVLRRAAAELSRSRPPGIILEVTESVLANADGRAAACLERLRQLGVRIALDDFGTGYSSISYLRKLPVDVLKTDRSFVSGEEAERPGNALLKVITGLALATRT